MCGGTGCAPVAQMGNIWSAIRLWTKSARREAFLAALALLTARSQVSVSGGGRLKGSRIPNGRGGGLASIGRVGNGTRETCNNKGCAVGLGGRRNGTSKDTCFLFGCAVRENEQCPLLGEEGILLRLLSNSGRGDKVKLPINKVTGAWLTW